MSRRLRTYVSADAGDTHPHTIELRAPVTLTPEQKQQARAWREVGLEFWEIAVEMGLSEQEVQLALATLRCKRADPPRISLNVSPAAAEFFKHRQLPGEPMWKTVNRILGL